MVVCVFNCLSILPAHAPKLMHTQYSLEPSGKIRFRIQFKEHWGGKDWRERERERERDRRTSKSPSLSIFCVMFSTLSIIEC